MLGKDGLTHPHVYVALLDCPDELPAQALLDTLTDECRARAHGFLSAKRRHDYLWGRVLLTALTEHVAPWARLVERPPLAPFIKSDIPLYASVSHTRGTVAVSLATVPASVDVEIMTASRVRQALFERVFLPELWSVAEQGNSVDYFYRAWGVYECAVKLPGVFRQSIEEGFWIEVPDGARRACVKHAVIAGSVMLTLAASRAFEEHVLAAVPDEGGLTLTASDTVLAAG